MFCVHFTGVLNCIQYLTLPCKSQHCSSSSFTTFSSFHFWLLLQTSGIMIHVLTSPCPTSTLTASLIKVEYFVAADTLFLFVCGVFSLCGGRPVGEENVLNTLNGTDKVRFHWWTKAAHRLSNYKIFHGVIFECFIRRPCVCSGTIRSSQRMRNDRRI